MYYRLLLILFSVLAVPAFAQSINGQIVWQKAGELPALGGKTNPGVAGAFVGVRNDVLIVAGGDNFPNQLPWQGGKKVFQQDIFVFKKAEDTLQSVPVITRLPQTIAYGSSVSTPEGLVYAGGENESGALKSVFRLTWNPEKQILEIQSLPDLPRPVSNALLVAVKGRIYLVGGESDGQTVANFLTLNLNGTAAGWQKLPDLPVAVSHAMGGIQSNGDGDSFFISGARSRNADGPSTFHNEGFAYDIRKHTCHSRQPLPGAGLSAGTGLAVGSTYILVVSGDDGNTFQQVEKVSRQLAASPNADTLLAQRSQLHANGSLNLSIVPQYARMLAHNGVKGAFVAGSTGEGVSLTYEEKRAVIEAWGNTAEKNLLKIAMVGGNSVAEMKQLAQLAEACGYEAVAILTPHYFKINSAETIALICREVGEAAPNTAVYFYHIPVLTGVNVSMIQLLEHLDGQIPNFAGIKYTHHDMMEYNQCLNYGGGKYDILWGWDEVFLGGMAMGARGGVGSTFNYAAPLYHRLMAAFDGGDLKEARRLQEKSIDIVKLLGKYGGISVGKAYMRALGLDCGEFRLPVRTMSEVQYGEFLRDLKEVDFFTYASQMPEITQ